MLGLPKQHQIQNQKEIKRQQEEVKQLQKKIDANSLGSNLGDDMEHEVVGGNLGDDVHRDGVQKSYFPTLDIRHERTPERTPETAGLVFERRAG